MTRERSEAREIRQEAERIERNRRRAPTTVAVADLLFDAARGRPSDALEELAILVDADAQRGVEYGASDLRCLMDRVRAALGNERS